MNWSIKSMAMLNRYVSKLITQETKQHSKLDLLAH